MSVLISCFNYADYIEESIRSVFNQTYINYEVIVINDGSEDNSDEVISNLNKEFDFKYIKQANKGIIYTRNKGVELSNGEYLIQLDADDYLKSDYISKTMECALLENADIVYTNYKYFGDEDFISNFPEFNLEILKHDNFISVSALTNKNIYNNRKYDSYLSGLGYEDWDLYLDACLDGFKAKLCKESLLYYGKHGKSRTDDLNKGYRDSLVRHHILNKQNSKRPEDFSYFSSTINVLRFNIDLNKYIESQNIEITELEIVVNDKNNYINELENELHAIRNTRGYRILIRINAIKQRLLRLGNKG